jgi:peptidoglycan/xylan/chitin deacetylase (PgdA/CDA1 family)
LRKLLRSIGTTDAALRLLAPLRPVCASVFFLHRFAWPDMLVEGHDPEILRARLEYLRKRRYRLISVGELLSQVEAGVPFRERSVVFTVDDGYADFAAVAAPIFAAYDCPVTVFLITDFTSGKLWNWFDRVPWVLTHTRRAAVTIEFAGKPVTYRWTTDGERAAVADEITEQLKRIADAEKERLIGELATSLEVDLPATAPPRDRAMTWEEVRRVAGKGVTYGPHTVTHPILSQVDDERSEREITESWRRVSSESGAAVPVFCYPNGTSADFSSREEALVRGAGMRAAFSTVEASISPSARVTGLGARFAVPRFVYPETQHAFIQAVSGIEALRGRVARV